MQHATDQAAPGGSARSRHKPSTLERPKSTQASEAFRRPRSRRNTLTLLQWRECVLGLSSEWHLLFMPATPLLHSSAMNTIRSKGARKAFGIFCRVSCYQAVGRACLVQSFYQLGYVLNRDRTGHLIV
jgi:hypothetical protein